MTIIPNNFSTDVTGTISPYPTVVIVAVAQYTDATYLIYQSESANSVAYNQLYPLELFSYSAIKCQIHANQCATNNIMNVNLSN